MIKLSPSILSADFANLQRDCQLVLSYGADMLHIDVMDGHFVPNISIGIPVVASLRRATTGFLDVHLMISQPEKYIDAFIKAGADLVNIHVEAEGDMNKMLDSIKAQGKKCALTVKPATPISTLFPYLDKLDMALIMSVEPGFGGQSFMPDSLARVTELRNEIDRRKLSCLIEIDGGITHETAPLAIKAGCDVLVAGSAVYNASNIQQAIKTFKSL